jgi:hypothetical protein
MEMIGPKEGKREFRWKNTMLEKKHIKIALLRILDNRGDTFSNTQTGIWILGLVENVNVGWCLTPARGRGTAYSAKRGCEGSFERRPEVGDVCSSPP